MDRCSVAVVGATGLVGREFLKILEQRRFPLGGIRLLASGRSKGVILPFGGTRLPVEELTPESCRGVDIALFSAGAEVSRTYAPIFAREGAVVVDNSAAWRMEREVPLVVPEVNAQDASLHNGIIANPNCSTIQMVVALNPLHQVNPIQRVVVDTYQSVSGAGSEGLEELASQVAAGLEGGEGPVAAFPHPIAFNLFPHIDTFLDNGYTREEWKMVQETRKIMHAPDMAVSATCVRVPVRVGHSEAIHIEMERPMTAEEVREILRHAPGVTVLDDPVRAQYPVPARAAGTDQVFVGRIREDASRPGGIAMWVVADNVRKGAALNAVQIAELLVGR